MRTAAEWLIDEIDRDLSSRRRELIDLRLMVASATGARGLMLSRTCHVMAYAHWEGCVKFALRTYLDHIAMQRVKLQDLKYELQALALMRQMKAATSAGRSISSAAYLLGNLAILGAEPFIIDAAEVMRVGNMTAENLRVVLECAGLAYMPSYSMRENFIDTVVCGRRHRIAHGQWQPVSAQEARDVIADVLNLCNQVTDQIQTAAVYQEFLR